MRHVMAILCFGAVLPGAAIAVEAEHRVEALLSAMGGRAAWAETRAMRIDATHHEGELAQPYENRIFVSFEAPRIRIEARNDSMRRVRAIVGEKGWLVSEKTARRAMTPAQVASDLQWWDAHIYRTVHRLARRDDALAAELAPDGRLLIKRADGSQLMWIRQNLAGEPLQFGVGEAASGTVFGPLLARSGIRIPGFSVSPDGTWRAIIEEIEANPDLTGIDQEDTTSSVRVTGLPWLSHVTGFCWRAQLSPGVKDRQCFRAQFDRVVRVEQRVTPSLAADSTYAWDARLRRIRHVFWASDGSFETSAGWAEGDALVFYLDRETDAKGEAPARTVLRKTGPDQYTASREAREGEAWKQQFAFVYERDGKATSAAAR